MKIALIVFAALLAQAQPVFTGKELLGRVSANAVTVNVEADSDIEAYFEYGAASGLYTAKTNAAVFPGGTPFAVVLGPRSRLTVFLSDAVPRTRGRVVHGARGAFVSHAEAARIEFHVRCAVRSPYGSELGSRSLPAHAPE